MESKFTPFVGLHYGRTNLKVTDATTTPVDGSGSVYGVQAGTLYAITDSIEFEANLAYSKSNFDEPDVINGGKLTIDKSTSLYVGFNYKF